MQVLRRGALIPKTELARDVCVELDRYFLSLDHERQKIDNVWSYYERHLARVLDELSNPSTPSMASLRWATVAVPFVASLLVRSPDFDRRYRARSNDTPSPGQYSLGTQTRDVEEYLQNPGLLPPLPRYSLDPDVQSDNLNAARLIEMQRLLLPVATARWVVLHAPNESPSLLLPDVGYILGGLAAVVEDCVLTVPIGPHAALALGFRWWMDVANGTSGQWRTPIEHVNVNHNLMSSINTAAAAGCEQLLVGSLDEDLAPYADALSTSAGPDADCAWLTIIDRTALCATELEWFSLISALAKRPGAQAVDDFELNTKVISRFGSQLVTTVDRVTSAHIALSTDPERRVITAALPLKVDLNHRSGAIGVAFAEGSPTDRIKGMVTDPNLL